MTGKKSIIFSIVMFLVGLVLLGGYMHVVSPAAIRWPKLDHAHIRLQIIANGQHINLGDAAFQTPDTVVCTDQLAAQPIHLHDNKDQFVHLHWKGLTGGLILKNYGWNLIGGPNDTLGYRLDELPFTNRVPIHGNVLPALSKNTPLWVYTGDDDSYTLRATQDFLQQDIETFLYTKSTVGVDSSDEWLKGLLFARASAHGGEDGMPHSQAELTKINNLLGNIVVFAQKDKPADAQVWERFEHLAPLVASTCGG